MWVPLYRAQAVPGNVSSRLVLSPDLREDRGALADAVRDEDGAAS
ncbi:hypothetical protein [Streptomyces sp. WAC06614]|nr:hypothetical protein [Streptomyces sp. WAC06614]